MFLHFFWRFQTQEATRSHSGGHYKAGKGKPGQAGKDSRPQTARGKPRAGAPENKVGNKTGNKDTGAKRKNQPPRPAQKSAPQKQRDYSDSPFAALQALRDKK